MIPISSVIFSPFFRDLLRCPTEITAEEVKWQKKPDYRIKIISPTFVLCFCLFANYDEPKNVWWLIFVIEMWWAKTRWKCINNCKQRSKKYMLVHTSFSNFYWPLIWKLKTFMLQIDSTWTNVDKYQFGCGISKMVGPKKQDFWPKISILKGNHCILRI